MIVPDTPEEAALFEAFRVLRERVFEGSDAFRQRVIHRVEQELSGQPTEPLGVALLVHAVNFLSSLMGPPRDRTETAGEAGGGSPRPTDKPGAPPDDEEEPR